MTNHAKELFQTIERICAAGPRYAPEAYLFTLSALHWTVAALPVRRHVTGQELCAGLKQYALEQFGPMARSVLEHWGVTTTLDVGQIVFTLVEHQLLGKTEEDRLEDFLDVYDFDEAFGPAAVSYTLADDLPDPKA